MKILLIAPPFKCFTGFYSYGFPTGLSILASIAREEGFEVSVCEIDKSAVTEDLGLSGEHAGLNKYVRAINDHTHPAWQEVKDILKSFKPDIVGITAYTTTFASALRTAELCKLFDPSIISILGGPHPTAMPVECFEHKDIDYIIIGEGEVPFKSLLKFFDGKIKNIADVPGIGYRKAGGIEINKAPEPIECLDNISPPRRDLLWYRSAYSPADMGLIMATRGCPFHCTYCFHFWGKDVRYRSVSSVVKEIEGVMKCHGASHFTFKDDMMTLNRKWILELCGEFKKRNTAMTWECTTRADILDAELLDAMILAGCVIVKIGVESGSQDILDLTKKNITKEKIQKTAELLNSRKIFWSAYFMYGLPFEKEEDIKNTCFFMKSLKPDYAALGLYQISPDTDLYEYGIEKGLYRRVMELDLYFNTNPKDYFLLNPQRRSLFIDPEKFKKLEGWIVREFDDYNTSFFRLLRRGLARRRLYMRSPRLFVKEIGMAIKWLIKNKLTHK